jgi:hypothetical protein
MLAAQALEARLCYRSPAGPAGLVWAPFKGRLCAALELCSHAMGSGLSRRREPQRNFKHYKDLWRMDLEQHTWELLPAKGGPAGRSGHRMALHRNRLIVFGGFNDSGKACQCAPATASRLLSTRAACAARPCQRAQRDTVSVRGAWQQEDARRKACCCACIRAQDGLPAGPWQAHGTAVAELTALGSPEMLGRLGDVVCAVADRKFVVSTALVSAALRACQGKPCAARHHLLRRRACCAPSQIGVTAAVSTRSRARSCTGALTHAVVQVLQRRLGVQPGRPVLDQHLARLRRAAQPARRLAGGCSRWGPNVNEHVGWNGSSRPAVITV